MATSFHLTILPVSSAMKHREGMIPALSVHLAKNSLKSDKAASQNYEYKVSVQKTDVSSGKDPPADSTEKKADGPEKNCFIYNKPHTPRKCRIFRGKTLEERKRIFKDNGGREEEHSKGQQIVFKMLHVHQSSFKQL